MTPSNLAAAKELSEIMGDQTIKSDSKSSDGNSLFAKSTSTSEQGRKLMNPDELLRLSKDKELVICQGCRPIICPKIRWFQEPFFKKRILAIKAPPFSDTCTKMENYSELFAVNAPDVEDMIKRQEEVAKARAEKAKKLANTQKSENKGKVSLEKLGKPQVQVEEDKNIGDGENAKQSATSDEAKSRTEKVIENTAVKGQEQRNQAIVKRTRRKNEKSLKEKSVQIGQKDSKENEDENKSSETETQKPKLTTEQIKELFKQRIANKKGKEKKFADIDLYAEKKPDPDDDDNNEIGESQ